MSISFSSPPPRLKELAYNHISFDYTYTGRVQLINFIFWWHLRFIDMKCNNWIRMNKIKMLELLKPLHLPHPLTHTRQYSLLNSMNHWNIYKLPTLFFFMSSRHKLMSNSFFFFFMAFDSSSLSHARWVLDECHAYSSPNVLSRWVVVNVSPIQQWNWVLRLLIQCSR